MSLASDAVEAHPPWYGTAAATASTAAPTSPTLGQHRHGHRVHKVDQVDFEVPERLEFIKSLGKGTYGCVASFKDEQTGQEVAIKKIPHPLRNPIEGKRCLREMKLLRLLKHDCIISLFDVLAPSSPNFSEVYLATELMDADLHTVICSDQDLGEEYIQFFIYHILRALVYLHSANVVHRDLKPLNVLVNKNCDIKICDFGLARGRAGLRSEDEDHLRTEYVGTRWYRAPEIVLTSKEYTAAVDVWGAGCILAELIGRKPIFIGKDFMDQIGSICKVLGTPTDDELHFIPEKYEYARSFIQNKFPGLVRQDWSVALPGSNQGQQDLLNQMLCFDPNVRISAAGALRHPYLGEYFCEEDEHTAAGPLDWSFDDTPLDSALLQSQIYQEMAIWHPEILERDREALAETGWHLELPPE